MLLHKIYKKHGIICEFLQNIGQCIEKVYEKVYNYIVLSCRCIITRCGKRYINEQGV